jgi:leucyl aminopeptidase
MAILDGALVLVVGAAASNVTRVRVQATTDRPLATGADTVALGVFDGEPVPAGDVLGLAAAELLASGEAGSAFRRIALTHRDSRRVIVIGLGERAEFDPERARVAAALVQRRAAEARTRTLCWVVPDGPGEGHVAALVEGTALAGYRFRRYTPPPGDEPPGLEQVILSAPADLSALAQRAATLVAAQNQARELGNRAPNDLTPAALADYAIELAAHHPELSVETIGGAEIRAGGMGAFAAVAQGSDQDPRLITLTYEPAAAGPRAPRLAFVGKAVTFDTGGLAIKSRTGMLDMKFDMAGGAAVIEAIGALAALRAPVRVLAVVGATENMINGRAVRPGDVVTALDGTTIEVNNPDAEGRLVLADCITHARRLGCDALIDIATLTGGVVTALGSAHAGLMANHDGLAELLEAAGARTGERVWRLPLHPDYAELVKGRYARLTNRPERTEAQAITAAEFLHHFADDLPWAHLDIAGVGDHGHSPYLDRGATGFGARLLADAAICWPGE